MIGRIAGGSAVKIGASHERHIQYSNSSAMPAISFNVACAGAANDSAIRTAGMAAPPAWCSVAWPVVLTARLRRLYAASVAACPLGHL
eukprot:5236649-Pleurochrysis_carterae.AAC.1